jgi:hypothetical protein
MVAACTRTTARADAAARVQQIVNQKRFTNQDSPALKTEPQCQFWPFLGLYESVTRHSPPHSQN